MAKKQKPTPAPADDGLKNVSDYRFPEATRKNNPPAKIAAEGYVPLVPKAEYLYSPRRPPELRFDPTGRADELPELLAKATKQKLTEAEAWALAEALRVHEPWLEWAGKREAKTFLVDPVALHIHERVGTQAILKVAAREDVNRSLFADPEQEYNEAVQFYKHDVDWSNRLILGDRLQVMSSLARREPPPSAETAPSTARRSARARLRHWIQVRVVSHRLRFEDGKMYQLRVVVAEDEQPPVIITAYRTSKIEKYWSTE